MTDEPDLSMLLPTTAEFLRLHAGDWALARAKYGPGDPRRYRLWFGQDVTNLIRSTARRAMDEMKRAYVLMRVLNTAARYLTEVRSMTDRLNGYSTKTYTERK